MGTHVPGFQSFFRFIASFCIGQISHQQIRVNKITFPSRLMLIPCVFYCFHQDVLTDLTADYECVDVDDLEDCHAHKGMNQAAKYIQTKIQQDQLLEQAFIRAQVRYSTKS